MNTNLKVELEDRIAGRLREILESIIQESLSECMDSILEKAQDEQDNILTSLDPEDIKAVQDVEIANWTPILPD